MYGRCELRQRSLVYSQQLIRVLEKSLALRSQAHGARCSGKKLPVEKQLEALQLQAHR